MVPKIALISLALSYFKGLISFKLEADGRDLDVYGDNAAGKTTLFDGFSYLLFDKDSRDKAQPEKWIKTLDASGQAIHQLEHEVEGVLLINGQRRTLRKVFSEKWTKKRGAATAEFTGHSTEYFIDGAPLKKSDYEAEIAAFIDEKTFKLLTNPTYFNEQFDKNERRKLLLEVCGDLSDEDVIASNPDLAALPSFMEGRTLDRHREKIKADQKRINDELKEIPVRISEIQRTMPAINGADVKTVLVQLDALRSRITGKEEELSRIQSGGEIAVKENRKRELQGELLQLKNSIQSGSLDKVGAQRKAVSQIQSRQAGIESEISKANRQVSANNHIISEKNTERERLRERWIVVDTEILDHVHQDDNCPTCGQVLPADQIHAAFQKAVENFNRSKSERLETIGKAGRAAKEEVERLTKDNEQLAASLVELNKTFESLSAEIAAASAKLNNLEAGIQDVDTDPAYISKQQEIAAIDREIVSLRSASVGALETARLELSNMRTEAEKLERERAAFDATEKGRERIAVLKDQEKILAKQYEELERQLFLTDEFIRTKVNLLESKINSMFRNVRFKLFETQVNGAINETCETLYGPNQVPYSGGLNRAAQLNSGLDIIETLSRHYKVSAPIFIDNAEAVTELVKTTGQQIRLIVPPAFNNLPLEVRERLIEQHGSYDMARKSWSDMNKQLRVVKSTGVDEILVDNEVLS
ncbi:MAG: AAA family ATPase [Bacillota bacterium]